jgi:DNA-binding CsgD family transcriptional regulator
VTEVLGRDGELARLADLLRSARDGDGSALILRGEAGIGKSALLEAAGRQARELGLTVLTARGTPAESRLPFGALHQVLWPLLRDGALPAVPRESLHAAFGQASMATPDLYGVAFAALDLLSEAAAAGPLLVAAEDAHWFDKPTTQVLSFVGQRLRSLPAAMVIAVRDGYDDAFADSGLTELLLGPLADGPARALLERESYDLPLGTRARVLDAARGNPLALLELPAAVRGSAETESSLGSLLPVTARLERAFAARLPEIPEVTRTALLVLAADNRCTLAEIIAVTAQVHGTDVSMAAIEPAAEARLVYADGTLLRFRHPLVASAVYHNAPLTHRIAVHTVLAGLPAGDPDRSVWHRAAAALGPDPATAADLAEFARRASSRGAVSVAVDALERAAALAADARQASGLLLRAARLASEIPHGKDRALTLVDKITPGTLDVRGRARRALVEDLAGRNHDDDVTLVRPLVGQAIAAWEDGDLELAYAIMGAAALRCWMNDAPAELRTWIAGSLDRLDPQLRHPGTLHVLAYLLPLERGRALARRAAQLQAASHAGVSARHMIMVQGMLGEWSTTVAGLTAAVPDMRARGRVTRVALYLGLWSAADIWIGEWDRALANGLEAEQLATATGDPVWRLFALGYQEWTFALRGQAEQAEAAAAQIFADPHATSYLRSVAQRGLGISALNAGRPEDAFHRLARLFDPTDPLHHYGLILHTVDDLADAARGCGRVSEARAIIAPLDRQIATTAAMPFQVGLNYARAVLADDEDAGPLLQAALAAELPPWPYHRARLHLAYGKWLRRQRRHAESRAPLYLALDILEGLGARHWAAQARGELRATGEQCRGPGQGLSAVSAASVLSAQEFRIAQLAARGLTNREIGQLLTLSQRTVGAHLYRIFPKLGITRRVQLAAVLTEGADDQRRAVGAR